MNMKSLPNRYAGSQGFTLIELIVVIAILAILAIGLLFTINPLDKINSANDASAISFVTQIGQAEDAYAANHNNTYAGESGSFEGPTTPNTLNDLETNGEVKSDTPPSNVTVTQVLTSGCSSSANPVVTPCASYVFYVALQADAHKNGTPPTGGPYFMYANGKGCYTSTAPTDPTTQCP